MRIDIPGCEDCQFRKNSLFSVCQPNELDEITNRRSCSEYKRGQIIFQEGTHPFGLFCIYTGKVKLYKRASDGKEQVVRIARSSQFLGYSSLIADQRYNLTAMAMEDCKICMVPKDQIQKLIDENHNFMESIIKLMGRSLDQSVDRMADLAYKPVRGRLAEALLYLSSVYKSETNTSGIITMTREDLASFVGTVKETVIRVLKEFKEAELVETDKSNIIIKNKAGLIKLGQLYD